MLNSKSGNTRLIVGFPKLGLSFFASMLALLFGFFFLFLGELVE